MNVPIWIISAAVVGAGAHPAGVLAVAAGLAVAVGVAGGVGVAASVGDAGGLALGEAAGGVAVAAEVHAASTSPSTTPTR
jgi:hypothetical protein